MSENQHNAEHLVLKLMAGGRDESDILCLIEIAKQKLEAGWENSDIIKYMYYTEHYADWSEDYALARLRDISRKYNKTNS